MEAAHIKPKSHGGLYLPNNGMALCRDLHWAFDKGFFTIDDDYDYVIVPDYMDAESNSQNCIVIPSHKNVSKNIVERVKDRYDLLERKLCMKH